MLDRRHFLKIVGGAPLVSAGAKLGAWPATRSESVRFPKPIGSPVLESVRPVIENSRYVRTDVAKIVETAGWMAYEDLPLLDVVLPLGVGEKPDEAIDFIMVSDSIDTAFTDFKTHVKFQMDYAGQHFSDSEALFACLKRAHDEGIPVTEGRFMAGAKRSDLEHIFRGNIEMPMLDEKTEIFNQVGKVLVEKYEGRFRNFITACSPRLYDNGNGIVEKLVAEFPRFNDVYEFEGHEIKIYKLAQLGVWMLYSALHKSGGFKLEDAHKMTAFADYIVPVGLRLLGIFQYSPDLEHAINTYQLIAAGSRQEIEIRAHTVYACALLAEEVNKLRPADLQVIIPQIDARIWTHYHTTFWPHHLTETVMY